MNNILKIKAFNNYITVNYIGDMMNLNLIAAILSIIVVAIGLYEILGLGEYTWTNYLSVTLFAIVFVLEVKAVITPKS